MPEANDQYNLAQPNGCDDLRGKTAMVTGSSSGIGRAIARRFASAGASVIVHAAVRETAVRELSQSIASEHNVSATYVVADLAKENAIDEVAERAWNWQGGVDIWVNNAGADVLTGAAAHLPFEEKLERLWQVDVCGTIKLSRLIGPRMVEASRAAGDHTILNMGWDQAQFGMAGDSGEMFAAVKGAVMAFSRSLAKSLAPSVRVNCLAPGWIKTAWGEKAPADWQQRAQGESLLQRWGTPEDVAQVATFLASQSSAFVNGQVVSVNGGFRGG